MARSLREELLKAGLVTSEQAARAERRNRQPPHPVKARAAGKSRSTPRSRTAKRPSKRELGESPRTPPSTPASIPVSAPVALPVPDPEEQVRQLNFEIRRILDTQAETAEPDSDTPFHFPRGDRLKRLYVSADQRRRLTAGELAIVGFRGRHHLVPRQGGERIRELRPEVFVFIASEENGTESVAEGYEGYEIPDGLVW